MPALTSIALAVGAASLGAGIFEKVSGDAKASEGLATQQRGYGIQQQAAGQLHDISVNQAAASVGFAGQNYGINAGAAQDSLVAAQQSSAINKNIYNDQLAIQQQKRQAMELDANRSQLEVIRNSQRARSMALFNAQSTGAQRGSGLQGGYGQISGQSNTNALGIQQNLQIGENVFNLNADVSKNSLDMNDVQTTLAYQRAATQTAQANLQYQYATSNAGFQTQTADAQSLMSTGQGVVNMGGGQSASGQMQSSFGSTLINAAPAIFSSGVTASNVFAGSTMGNWFNSPAVNTPLNISAAANTGNSFIGPPAPFNPFNYTGSSY